MAVVGVGFPRILSLHHYPPHHQPFQRRTTTRRRRGCFCSQRPNAAEARESRNGLAILWFKQDLRVDDHPGLVAASKYQAVVPLYVFDHRILSGELLGFFSDKIVSLFVFERILSSYVLTFLNVF